MKTLFLNRESFLNWYFSEDIDITPNVWDALLSDGKYELNIQELLDSVAYISEDILEVGQEYKLEENGDVNIENVILKIN